jgi:hypothetical protein
MPGAGSKKAGPDEEVHQGAHATVAPLQLQAEVSPILWPSLAVFLACPSVLYDISIMFAENACVVVLSLDGMPTGPSNSAYTDYVEHGSRQFQSDAYTVMLSSS